MVKRKFAAKFLLNLSVLCRPAVALAVAGVLCGSLGCASIGAFLKSAFVHLPPAAVQPAAKTADRLESAAKDADQMAAEAAPLAKALRSPHDAALDERAARWIENAGAFCTEAAAACREGAKYIRVTLAAKPAVPAAPSSFQGAGGAALDTSSLRWLGSGLLAAAVLLGMAKMIWPAAVAGLGGSALWLLSITFALMGVLLAKVIAGIIIFLIIVTGALILIRYWRAILHIVHTGEIAKPAIPEPLRQTIYGKGESAANRIQSAATKKLVDKAQARLCAKAPKRRRMGFLHFSLAPPPSAQPKTPTTPEAAPLSREAAQPPPRDLPGVTG